MVWAGPPLRTDDPGTPGERTAELNVAHVLVRTRSEVANAVPLFDLNYGQHENDQWTIHAPALVLDPAWGNAHGGVGDVLLGWKYRFLEEDEAGFMASISPQLICPTGNANLGLGEGRFASFFPLEVGRHFLDERLFVYGEVGYHVVFGSGVDNAWRYGVAASWKANERLELMGEIAGDVLPRHGGPNDTFFNLGFKWKLGEHVALLGSAGRSFHGRGHDTPELMTFLGLQITWGGAERPENGPAP